MKKIAILQSNYIPWKGYFDLIAAVDEFVLYDDMQYTRRDWRNRNLIKTINGPKWLTIPVKVKGKYFQTIRETEIDGSDWINTHWKTLQANYSKAPYYKEISALLEPVYCNSTYTHLSQLNRDLIVLICNYLGIKSKITNSWDYNLCDGKSERLADLCQQAKGTEYLSGPAAKDYIEESIFTQRGLKLTWFDYSGYPEYSQQYDGFEHAVTILDLLFNCGPNSSKYMRYV